ncbi:MAG TPA: acetyl-CoA carboxylase biotin carboxyl carrier protein [Bryobacteraceae bacterium]|nr:acetyl-CoA carboxylase biotin carboxyl carrier protein [Bryobacteraceae bacterium]
MTIAEIRELIEVVRETGILELEVKRGDDSVRIRAAAGVSQEIVMPAVHIVPNSASAAQAETAAAASAAASAAAKEDARNVLVKSPIVGTFYDASAPGAEPFVKNGDAVEPKTVICIIESMKLMNEIEAEVAGTVIARHVENGRPVEYGESLFTIRPH